MHHTPVIKDNHHKLESYLEGQTITYVESGWSRARLAEFRITTSKGPIIIRSDNKGLLVTVGHCVPRCIQ